MRLFAVLLGAACASARANEQEIQRSVVQRDQQSAEFAARVRGEDTRRLEELHARQLAETVRPQGPAPDLHPYQRQKMAEERVLVLPPPSATLTKPPEKPLPLPGGPRHGIDPIPAQGIGN